MSEAAIDLRAAMESLWRSCVRDVEVTPKVILVGRDWVEMTNAIRARQFPRWAYPLVRLRAERPQFPAWRRHWSWWGGKSQTYWRKRRHEVKRFGLQRRVK